MKKPSKAIMAAFAAMAGAGAFADPSITVNSVTQRWPWNNKVDITYTVSGGQDVTNGLYAAVEFTATIGSTNITIAGSSVGASASDGEHTVTWNAPSGLRATDATMTATLVATNFPSGNDYMIVDLTTGDIYFEGLYGYGAQGQTNSNTRYNTDTYKTTKMVLRKIPKWSDAATLPNYSDLPSGGYPTGNTSNSSNDNLTYRQPEKDYYIGVFMMTATQYKNIYGSLPSSESSSSTTIPVGYTLWSELRGDILSTNSLSTVTESSTGAFFERLNYLTGNTYTFDLPSWPMSELAVRAGCMNSSKSNTLAYWYGSTADTTMCVYTGGRVAVGSKPANPWGLYDACGNGFEWILDDAYSTMHSLDVFEARCKGTTKRLKRNGGGAYNGKADSDVFKVVGYEEKATTDSNQNAGFRVAVIID